MASSDFVKVRLLVAAGHGISVRQALLVAKLGAEITQTEVALNCVEPEGREFKGTANIMEIITHRTAVPRIHSLALQVTAADRRGQALSAPRITATPFCYISDQQRQQICELLGIQDTPDPDDMANSHLVKNTPAQLRALFPFGKNSALDLGDRRSKPELVDLVQDALVLFRSQEEKNPAYSKDSLNKKSRPELALLLFDIVFG